MRIMTRLVLISILLVRHVRSQDSVKVVNNEDSCSIINFNCGEGQKPAHERTVGHNLGRPGKRGAAGMIGPKGEKGVKGDQGIKGNAGDDADISLVRKDFAQHIGIRNCQEVKDVLGIETSGHYLMHDPTNINAVFIFCDFQVRNGISTCKRLEEVHHVKESGFYWLRPSDSDESFQVYCNFSNKEVTTEIWHDLMRETVIGKCEDKGCYSAIPEYNIKQQHIMKVMSGSRECRQYLKLRCHGVVIGGPFAWWVSRDGEKMLYWGGSTSRRTGYCSCGESGNCFKNDQKCNCDNNGLVMTSDAGYLTDSTKLPVKQIFFGDSGDAGEIGWHTLGQLECKG